jgi:ABC-type transport system involved in multi-copper enzyme maturation permease subunit
VLRFWRNPLLILHVRSDLRPARAVTAAVVTLVVCTLIGMGCWSVNSYDPPRFWTEFYGWVLGAQFVLLGVWSAGTCGQAVARERELKTFDFLKTTRLTPAEIMVGKLLGAPIVAYFIVACTLPISIVAGLVGGFRPVAVFGSIVLLLAFNLFYSLVALLGSMLVEKSSSGATGLLGLLANLFFLAFANSPFKGFTAISIVPALFSLYRVDMDLGQVSPTVFGMKVPCIILTLVLYALLGAWLVLMIVRNLKRDLPQIQLLSRWQCVGQVAFWNLLFYAFLDTQSIMDFTRRHPSPGSYPNHAYEIATFAVAWNAVFLFLIGLAALSPHEKLRIWWRKWKGGEASYFAPDGLPWPWLVLAAIIGYAMLAAEALGLRSAVRLGDWRLGFVALAFGAFLVFTTRDILFLQWCLLTRMKHPVMYGILFLLLYNAAVGLLGLVVSVFSSPTATKVLTLLTPYVLIGEMEKPTIPPAFITLAIALQVGVCVLILLAIQRRLARPVHAPVAGVA